MRTQRAWGALEEGVRREVHGTEPRNGQLPNDASLKVLSELKEGEVALLPSLGRGTAEDTRARAGRQRRSVPHLRLARPCRTREETISR